jgi:transcriptional regulator with XRE-family HTH domain
MSRLADLRNAAELSQSKLAAKSGVPVSAIQQYEIGYRDINGAAVSRVKQLADALGCRIEDLIEDAE